MFLLLALLALAACDEKDEPTAAKIDADSDLYLVVNGWEELDNAVIYSASGDTIYVAVGGHINNIETDGSDWYALIVDSDEENRRSHIIKNGQELFSTDEDIHSLCVDGGNVYTLRDKMMDWHIEYQWVYKNQERIYQIDANEYFSTQMLVDNGHITLEPYYSPTPRYWQDGQFVAMQGLEGELEYCTMDKVGDDILLGFSGEHGKYGYWRNGQLFNNPINGLSINGVKLVNGKVILVGTVVVSQGVTGVNRASVIMIDGKEYRPEGTTRRMRRYGKDFYILTKSNLSQVLKNMEPIPLGYVNVKNEQFQEVFGDRMNLSEMPISDFAIIKKKK